MLEKFLDGVKLDLGAFPTVLGYVVRSALVSGAPSPEIFSNVLLVQWMGFAASWLLLSAKILPLEHCSHGTGCGLRVVHSN
jgi:hypothetical protein